MKRGPALQLVRSLATPPEILADRQRRRGYHAVYRPDETNRCPGCGRSHWIVGRQTAECAFCMTALPIAVPAGRG